MPEDNFHPAAGLFPLLEGAEFEQLINDIRAHGLREPIWRHRDGRILDGRNRWRACQEAGVECPSRTFAGADEEIIPFVVSMNLHRRHLTTSQRAMVAAELATMRVGRRSEKAHNCAISDRRAAGLMNVSERSVEKAKAVRREGVPELQQAVQRGDITVSRAAEMAEAEPEQQHRILAGKEPVEKPAPQPQADPEQKPKVITIVETREHRKQPDPASGEFHPVRDEPFRGVERRIGDDVIRALRCLQEVDAALAKASIIEIRAAHRASGLFDNRGHRAITAGAFPDATLETPRCR